MLIHLYADPSTKALRLEEISQYLQSRLGARVDLRPDFVRYHLSTGERNAFARKLATLRVTDPNKAVADRDPFYGEVEFEGKTLLRPELRPSGIMYDGFLLHHALGGLLKPEETDLRHMHIVFTGRLFGTFEEGERRYHARVIICGFPSLISTTGVVEGPAKPREFYFALTSLAGPAYSMAWEKLKEDYKGRFIDYDDERITEVMKGYVMQAIFHHGFQEPFCTVKGCRLYNAHWQEEVIKAQLTSPQYCHRHEELITLLRSRLMQGA